MTDIRQLDSKIVYQNNWMTVREDKTRRPSGAEGIYGVVHKPDFVVIVPVQDGQVTLVQQYRYPVQARYWEFPQGSWESAPDADPLQVAAGELQEETGLLASSIVHVGYQHQAYGYSDQGFHIYMATDLTQGAASPDAEEEDLISRSFPLSEFERMVIDGEITDSTTISAYGLIKLKGLL
jgi:8-oxo-dGTP pyrophosphatase MutT (NUDIX family)